MYQLELEATKGCLFFVESMIAQGKEKTNKDETELSLIQTLSDFRNFLVIATNSEIDPVVIPERYNKIYECAKFGATMGLLLSINNSEEDE